MELNQWFIDAFSRSCNGRIDSIFLATDPIGFWGVLCWLSWLFCCILCPIIIATGTIFSAYSALASKPLPPRDLSRHRRELLNRIVPFGPQRVSSHAKGAPKATPSVKAPSPTVDSENRGKRAHPAAHQHHWTCGRDAGVLLQRWNWLHGFREGSGDRSIAIIQWDGEVDKERGDEWQSEAKTTRVKTNGKKVNKWLSIIHKDIYCL
jgi:hypothetical protein